jgi:hypothetical protein
MLLMAMLWLRQLVDIRSPQKPGFDTWLVHVGFMVDKVVLEQVFLHVLCMILAVDNLDK